MRGLLHLSPCAGAHLWVQSRESLHQLTSCLGARRTPGLVREGLPLKGKDMGTTPGAQKYSPKMFPKMCKFNINKNAKKTYQILFKVAFFVNIFWGLVYFFIVLPISLVSKVLCLGQL